jgi:hypothetical protein
VDRGDFFIYIIWFIVYLSQTYQVDKIDDELAQENGLSLMPNLKNIQIKGIKVLNKNTDEFEFQKVELDIFSKK